jgi:hypothetical protein
MYFVKILNKIQEYLNEISEVFYRMSDPLTAFALSRVSLDIIKE